MKKLVLWLGVLLFLLGCNGTADSPEPKPSTIALIGSGTRLAVGQGLAALVMRNPEKLDAYTKAAVEVRDALNLGITPVLRGAKLEDVTRALADKLLGQLDGVTDPAVKTLVQLGINLVLDQVTLPANPTERLTPAARASITAFFDGVAGGCDDFLAGTAAAAASLPKDAVPTLAWERR